MAKYGWLTKRHSVHPTTDFSLLDAPEVLAVAALGVSLITLNDTLRPGARAGLCMNVSVYISNLQLSKEKRR